jgi:hypothetical protein
MTKQTDTMSGDWPSHMKWSSPGHSISLFCHEMVKPQTWHQCVLSWNDQSPDIVSVGFGMKWSSPRHSICLFCHEMGLDHFMPNPTDTMSGDWSFHDKTHWCHVWSLTISWQNRLILCLGIDHFMTKHTDTMSGAVLSWNGQAPDIVSVCFVMKLSIPRHSISLCCHEMVKPHAWFQCALSWNGQAPCMVSVCFSWQNKLILCLRIDHFMTKHTDTMSGLDHFMTKQTDTMSEDWPFHDKTHR